MALSYAQHTESQLHSDAAADAFTNSDTHYSTECNVRTGEGSW